MSSGSGAKKVMGSLVRGWIKVKPEGVERLPVYKAVIRMVEKISGRGVADMVIWRTRIWWFRVQSQADIGKIILLLCRKAL